MTVTSAIPKATQLRAQISEFLDDTDALVNKCISVARSTNAFGEIYRSSLATDVLLKGLSDPTLRPSVVPARSVVLRIPVLVAVGQPSVAQAELRRFVELTLWMVYFTDHRVEWTNFVQKARPGFSQDARRPISYAAHRELLSYLEYARELMEDEPSGLGVNAIDGLKQVVRALNASVHAGKLARFGLRLPGHDDLSEPTLRSFAQIQRQAFSHAAVILCAYRRSRFDHLTAIQRAHFDWMIGPKLRKHVRSGPFGLP